MYRIFTFLVACGFLFFGQDASAYINPEQGERGGGNNGQQIDFRADCAQSTAQRELDVNNVRALLLGGGDKWWDFTRGRYIVPNVEPGSGLPEVSSIFAGSVWLGGYDPSGNLKMAANTYRSGSSNDFFPGPLTEQGVTDEETCLNWDQMFEVRSWEIDSLLRMYNSGQEFTIEDVPEGVRYYPALGNEYFFDEYDFELPDAEQGLGAFYDEDGNGLYDPLKGDYPVIQIRGCELEEYPDQMLFWIYNDNGGPHTNTNGSALRMEVQVQAFAFQSNDEINNMTFYRYKLINRAIESIDSTFFAMWTDPDLGCTTDDYIGCDTSRSLMYTYNQDATDGEPGCTCADSGDPTYCNEVPIVGIDYFRGPLGPKKIGPNGQLINPALGEGFDTIVELGMSSFQYYNNPSIGDPIPATTDPDRAQQYYNYLSGSWRDGTPVSFGGNGYSVGAPPESRIPFVFTDPPNSNTGWSMCTADLPQADRRTIQASGPFRLDPGQVNELIVGVVWVPDIDYPCPSLTRLLAADEKAQALFDNCFDITDGPDAPDVEIIELDKELIFVMTNDTVESNNAFLEYKERGLEIPPSEPDSFYTFQGYQVYQLADQTVEPVLENLRDPSKARIIFQADVRDTVTELYNWTSIQDPNDPSKQVFIPELQVENAANEGIRHTFRVTEDQFSETDDRGLINHKDYYFTVLAYGYNNYKTFDYNTNEGQEEPYLAGRNNVNAYTGTPHPVVYKKLNTEYGNGGQVKRLDGIGSGGNFLDLAEGMDEQILENGSADEILYEMGRSPITINTYNPIDVVPGDYRIEFFDEDLMDGELDEDAMWKITRLANGDTDTAYASIDRVDEQVFGKWGFSVTIAQVPDAGVNPSMNENNGFVGSEVTYESETLDGWYGYIQDGLRLFPGELDPGYLNFIQNSDQGDFASMVDPKKVYDNPENVMYPFIMCEGSDQGIITPGWSSQNINQLRSQSEKLAALNNVDIVLTPDKSKWSRCVVMETITQGYFATGGSSVGGAQNMHIRMDSSVSKEAGSDGMPVKDNSGTIGMAWFPGYAINVETGKRVNVFFGENSFYRKNYFLTQNIEDSLLTGGDMMFNPHSSVFVGAFPDTNNVSPGQIGNWIVGGQHNIYVTDQEYDGCASIHDSLTRFSSPDIVQEVFRRRAYLTITWSNISMLGEGFNMRSYADGLIPEETRIKMRVNNPYQVEMATGVNNGHNAYEFNLDYAASRDLTQEEVGNALDQINVVPNPYYAYSPYERNTTDNRVKITNLPDQSTVTIYSLDGRYIRQYDRNLVRQQIPGNNPGAQRNQTNPDLVWDLRNFRGIPVGSGVYLIHVQAPGLGERVLKWFGIQRAFDASQF